MVVGSTPNQPLDQLYIATSNNHGGKYHNINITHRLTNLLTYGSFILRRGYFSDPCVRAPLRTANLFFPSYAGL